ncbi:hypothetical protein ACFX2C_009217 [Malus domestica]
MALQVLSGLRDFEQYYFEPLHPKLPTRVLIRFTTFSSLRSSVLKRLKPGSRAFSKLAVKKIGFLQMVQAILVPDRPRERRNSSFGKTIFSESAKNSLGSLLTSLEISELVNPWSLRRRTESGLWFQSLLS